MSARDEKGYALASSDDALLFFASQLEAHFVQETGDLRIAHQLTPMIAAHLRALLASRPVQAERRPCTNPHNDTSDPNHHCWHARETCCHCETSRATPRLAR